MKNINKEIFFTMGEANYMGLIELLVKSLNKFSSRKILVYGVNCDVPFDSDNMIKKRVDFFTEDELGRIQNNTDNKWHKGDIIGLIMFKKYNLCIDVIESGYERGVWLDGDAFVTKNIDNIWKDFDDDSDYPLLTRHCIDYLIINWRDETGVIRHRGGEGEEIERPLMENYFGKYSRSTPYLQACFFTFNKNCIDFFKQAIEVSNFCTKAGDLYGYIHDEALLNILIWNRGGKKYLPVLSFNNEASYPYTCKENIPEDWHPNIFKGDFQKYFNYFFMSNQDIKKITTSKIIEPGDINNLQSGFKLGLFHYFPFDRNQTLMFHGNKCVAQGTRMFYDYCINVGELSLSSFTVTDVDFINRKIYFNKGNGIVDKVKLKVYTFIKTRNKKMYYSDTKIYLSENSFDLKDSDATSFFITYPKTDVEYISVSINDFINDECEYVFRKK